MQRGIEEHARDAAGGMRESRSVRAMPADDAAARDLRRAVQVDAERVDDRQRVVRKKLAAEFVAREGVAIDERDGEPRRASKRGERRAAGAGADDGDIDVHLSSSAEQQSEAERHHRHDLDARRACHLADRARFIRGVAARTDAGASYAVMRPTRCSMPSSFTKRNGSRCRRVSLAITPMRATRSAPRRIDAFSSGSKW